MHNVEDGEIIQDDIANQATVRSKALTFKSSKKRKPSSVPSIDTIDFKFVKPEPSEIIDNNNLKQIIDNIENALEKRTFFVKSFHDEHLSQTINTNISILSNEEKLANAHQLIGKKPSSMVSEFDAPTIWSTLALVGSKLSSYSKDLDAKVTESLKSLKPNDDINIVQVMEPQIQQLDGRIDVLKKSILEIGTSLHQQIGLALSNHQTPARGNLSGLADDPNGAWKESIEKDLKMLKTLADNEAIRFGSLGFKTLRECIDWLKAHSPELEFGHLVDAHIVLEYLFRDIETGASDFLQSQLLLAKNKLANAHEGCTITSFERSIPRLFLKSGRIRLIKHDESYFDTMPKYEDWKTSETGYRDFLVEALKTYKSTHIQFLRSELSTSSTMYQLAYESVLFSVGWLEDLVRYIYETYKEYTETRLNAKKAWSITTRLARALLNDISKPRNSIRSSLKTQNKKQMKRVSFYGSLKSLDRMMDISEVGFKNSPIVSNELVKVLAKNTNIAAIEQLQIEFKGLQHENDRLRSELAEVKSKAIESSKIANGANNKSDTAKNDVAALTKRVQKLEKP